MPLYQLKISGRVQGVGYRYHTRQKAEQLGLKGTVRNEVDGSVYAEIEGAEAALQAMIEWCRRGPPPARVEAVDVQPGAEKGYVAFEILR